MDIGAIATHILEQKNSRFIRAISEWRSEMRKVKKVRGVCMVSCTKRGRSLLLV